MHARFVKSAHYSNFLKAGHNSFSVPGEGNLVNTPLCSPDSTPDKQ